jgi:hypothetical protein
VNTLALDSGLVHPLKVTDRVAVLGLPWRTVVAAFVIALFAVVVAGVAARAGAALMDGSAPDSLIWPVRR